MIVPGSQDFTAYLGATFDTVVTVYPSSASQFTWVGAWASGTNYSVGNVVIGTDNQAYDALRANVSVNPIGDATGNWSTPITPANLNGYSAYITVGPIAADELTAGTYLATPIQIQGVQGQLNIKFRPAQFTTPLVEPGTYHHYVTVTDSLGNIYYYLNGNFILVSP